MPEEERERPREKKWKYEISYWQGKPRVGEWVPESVATSTRRTFTHHTRRKGVTVIETVEELCYMHHGYRPKFDNEKATRKAFYFRGARVWKK